MATIKQTGEPSEAEQDEEVLPLKPAPTVPEDPGELPGGSVMVKGSLTALDGGWGWWVVVGAMLSHALMGGIERSSGIVYLQLLDKFNRSATETSWIFSIFTAFRLLFGPVASALCNRCSCRTVTFIGGILAGLSFIISGFTTSLEFLYFSYGILGGFGRCLACTPALIVVGYYFDKRRGLAVGLTTSGVGIGTLLIPPLLEILFQNYDFTGTFLIMGAISFNFLLAASFYRPQSYAATSRLDYQIEIKDNEGRELCKELEDGTLLLNKQTNSQEMEIQADGTVSQTANSVPVSVLNQHRSKSVSVGSHSPITLCFCSKMCRMSTCTEKNQNNASDMARKRKPLLNISLLKEPTFFSFCVGTMLFTIAFHASFVFLPPLAKAQGLSEMDAAYIVSVAGVIDMVFRIISTTLLDLKQVKRFRLYIYNGVMFLLGAVCFLLPYMDTFSQLAVVSGMFGVLSGSFIAQKSVVIVDILSVEELASALGLLSFLQGVGSLLGPLAGGILKDVQGQYASVFYFGGAGTFLGAIILMMGSIRKYHMNKQKE